MSSVGDATSADTVPATAAQPKRPHDESSPPLRCISSRSIARFVPNWLAVMGAMLPQLICGPAAVGRVVGWWRAAGARLRAGSRPRGVLLLLLLLSTCPRSTCPAGDSCCVLPAASTTPRSHAQTPLRNRRRRAPPLLTSRPLYIASGVRGSGLPSCSAFLNATIGCMRHTSITPPTAPISVCSAGVTREPAPPLDMIM